MSQLPSHESRDPRRIGATLAALSAFWEAHPDLRLAQVLALAASVHGICDPFHLEDEDLVRVLTRLSLDPALGRLANPGT